MQLWLIPILPLAGFLINGIFGRRFSKSLVNTVAIGSVVLSFLWVLKTIFAMGDLNTSIEEHYFTWIQSGTIDIGCDFLVDRLPKSGFGTAFEILIYLKQPDQPHRLISPEQSVGIDTFQLGCTPMVNLFERIAEPIRITQTKTEYHIVPDQHRQWATEVYSVDRVASASYLEEPRIYEPFYSLRHGTADD